jgi:bifunctional non-homologous end joining protein LigD
MNRAGLRQRLLRACKAILAHPVKPATLDGEGVMVDKRGLTDFERLRSALARCDGSRALFLHWRRPARHPPWETRRSALASLLRIAKAGIRLSEHLDGAAGADVFEHACRLGLEGIVSKRVDKPYRSGRCVDWVKVKNPDAPAVKRIAEIEW